MDGIKYEVSQFYTQYQVRMTDPVFGHPWYLKYTRNGQYEWTASDLSAKCFSLSTAQRHVRDLEAGADKDWPAYHKHWKDYLDEIRAKKEETV